MSDICLRSDLVRQYADSLQISFELAYKILSHPYRLGEVNRGYPHYPIEIEKIIFYEDNEGKTCSLLKSVKY